MEPEFAQIRRIGVVGENRDPLWDNFYINIAVNLFTDQHNER